MMQEVSWSAANVRRLRRHALLPPASSGTNPAEIATVICGAHAQVLSAAELSLALRIQAATRTTIRHALWDDHRLIKTYGPRGTVHLLATEDLPIWTAALSAIPAHTPFPDDVRLTPAQAEEIVDAIGQRARGCRTHDRRPGSGRRRSARSMGRRSSHARVPRHVAAVAAGRRHGCSPWRAVLRPEPGPPRDLYQSAPLAPGV